MRKIRCFLSVVLMGLLLCGCQIILFPETREDESGQQQNPSSGQNGSSEEPSTDPVLKVRTLGMYNIDGADYAYRRGEWQVSRNYSADGRSVTFSLVDPSNRVAYTVSGIKTSVARTGHSIYVTFTARTPEKEIKSFSSTAVVLRVSGDTLWLKTSQGPYYVIKK